MTEVLSAPEAGLEIDLQSAPDDSPVIHTKAMIEAMDTEIGRLLSSINPAVRVRTTVIFVGDNGTAGPAADGPFGEGKTRGHFYSERAVRNDRYKVIRYKTITGPFDPPTITYVFFDLEVDPLENRNLLRGTPNQLEREIFLRLRAKLLAP